MRWNIATRGFAVLLGAAVLFSLPGAAFAGAGHGEWEQVVDGYHVQLVISETVNPGRTPVGVVLSRDGLPVANAEVQVFAVLKGELAGAHGEGEAGAHGEAETEDSHSAVEEADTEAGDAHGETEGGHSETSADAHTDLAADSHTLDAGDVHAAAGDRAQPDGLVWTLDANGTPGTYVGSVNLADTGQWALEAHFTVDGHERIADYLISVVPIDRGGSLLAAFLGLNTTIIGTAAVFKRKAAAR